MFNAIIAPFWGNACINLPRLTIKDKAFSKVNRQDYIRFVNQDIKVRLKEQQNGKLTYKGKILGLEGECVVLKSKNVELRFEYNNIKSANLILTDAMFKELLKGIKK